MKKLKLGFMAIALIIGATSAFATKGSNQNVDCTQGYITAHCSSGTDQCCAAADGNVIDGNGNRVMSGQPVQGFLH